MLRSRNGEDARGEIVTGVGSLRRKYANTEERKGWSMIVCLEGLYTVQVRYN